MNTKYNYQKATLIKTDGTTEVLTPKNGKSFTYNEIREAIRPGCLIQPICLRYYRLYITNKEDLKMNFICDEEGGINGSPLNKEASDLLKSILGPYAQDLYGNIIFLPNKLFRI